MPSDASETEIGRVSVTVMLVILGPLFGVFTPVRFLHTEEISNAFGPSGAEVRFAFDFRRPFPVVADPVARISALDDNVEDLVLGFGIGFELVCGGDDFIKYVRLIDYFNVCLRWSNQIPGTSV